MDFTKITASIWTTTKLQFSLLYCIFPYTLLQVCVFFNYNPKHSNTCVTYIQQRKVFSKVMDSWQKHMPEGECSSRELWRASRSQCPESLGHMLTGPWSIGALKGLLLSSGLGFAIVELHRPLIQRAELLLARN